MEEDLKKAILDAVDFDNCALLFSGGVDSTTIAKILKDKARKFRCYTAGVENAEDVRWAKEVAEEMKLDWVFCKIELSREILKEIMDIIGFKDVVSVSVAIPMYFACKQASKDFKKVVSGLGTEEIFAGYQRHKNLVPDYEAVHKECWRGITEVIKKDLKRDSRIAEHFGMRIIFPFMNEKVIEQAMKIPAERKITKETTKIILREIAEELGVPKKVAWRKKRAAQYGSKAMKMLKKIAKQNGFERIQDFLNSI